MSPEHSSGFGGQGRELLRQGKKQVAKLWGGSVGESQAKQGVHGGAVGEFSALATEFGNLIMII